MKRTYKVTHDGKEFTRKTERTYSHVVIVKGARSDGIEFHCPMYWVGRPDLLPTQVKNAGKLFKLSDIHVIELAQPAA